MPTCRIVRKSEIKRTGRVAQLEGLFDIAPSTETVVEWDVDFDLPDDWHVGVIVGHSGAGKSTIAREIFGEYLKDECRWDEGVSIVDHFPSDLSIKKITECLSSVGFSSPPSWLKPYHVLSTGEKFRVNIARHVLENDFVVIDEYTSVVDRTVAQIGSHAVQKLIRKQNKKFVAVTCHYDVFDWLQPDWVYEPHNNKFSGRWLHPRPKIELDIFRVGREAWSIFAPHHYMSRDIHKGAVCFMATLDGRPVAFCSWLHFPHAKIKNAKREHRTVCLPDYQGVGIGNILSGTIASMWIGLGFRVFSTTANPSMIASRNKSNDWALTLSPRMRSKGGMTGNFFRRTTSLVASFEYMGIGMEKTQAMQLLGSW